MTLTYHAHVRAIQRYGMEVGTDDLRDIQDQITNGLAEKLGKRGRRTTIYKVTVQGREAVIVFNRAAKVIVTFLPMNWEKR